MRGRGPVLRALRAELRGIFDRLRSANRRSFPAGIDQSVAEIPRANPDLCMCGREARVVPFVAVEPVEQRSERMDARACALLAKQLGREYGQRCRVQTAA